MAEEIGRLAGLVAAMLLGALGPALAASWLLIQRRRRRRAKLKSPIARKLLRGPGYSLREQLDDGRSDIAFDLAVLVSVPSLAMAYFFVHDRITGRVSPDGLVALVLAMAAAVCGWMAFTLWKRAERLDDIRLGLDAEVAVGQVLDELGREGAHVFHDVPADGFNIDHVVVAAQGVYAIETKGRSKRTGDGGRSGASLVHVGEQLLFPGWTDRLMIEQARTQALWLQDWLGRATGQATKVAPVLALPGWWVEHKTAGTVNVFSGRELATRLLRSPGVTPLDAAQRTRVVHQLDQRCRTVVPTYSQEPA